MLNAVNFIGIDVQLDGRVLDLHTWRPSKFRRTLDMYRGELVRSFQVEDGEGRVYSVEARRFVSKDRRELACIRYSLTLLVDPPGRGAQVKFTPYLEGNVVNEDANYGEDFWQRVEEFSGEDYQLVTMEVKKSGFVVAAASTFRLYRGQEEAAVEVRPTARPRYAGAEAELTVHSGETVSLEKLVAVTTSRDHPRELVSQRALELVRRYCSHNYRELFARHAQAWAKTWGESDIAVSYTHLDVYKRQA